MAIKSILPIAGLALLSLASAHLEPGSLSSPKAGQSLAAGSRVNITWVQAEFHQGKYSLDYSRDGGSTWESIASWTGPGGDHVTVNYAWTVPDAPGSATQVRICQLGECNDPDYRLVSGNFTIAPASSIKPSAPAAAPSLRFLAASRRLEASFGLERKERVVLEAFDAKGSRVATLIDGIHAAGLHSYSLDSRRLHGGAALVLRLSLGTRIAARAILPSP